MSERTGKFNDVLRAFEALSDVYSKSDSVSGRESGIVARAAAEAMKEVMRCDPDDYYREPNDAEILARLRKLARALSDTVTVAEE